MNGLPGPMNPGCHQSAEWCDAHYREVLASRRYLLDGIRQRWEATIDYVVGSVLDLGFGLAEVYNMIGDREYLGVDYSQSAINYARNVNRNPNAKFLRADFTKLPGLSPADTVIMTEVLEHVLEPRELVQTALSLAKERIVVTVPLDMPDLAHVWPRWTKGDLEYLFSNLTVCEIIDDYWLAVHEQRAA